MKKLYRLVLLDKNDDLCVIKGMCVQYFNTANEAIIHAMKHFPDEKRLIEEITIID